MSGWRKVDGVRSARPEANAKSRFLASLGMAVMEWFVRMVKRVGRATLPLSGQALKVAATSEE